MQALPGREALDLAEVRAHVPATATAQQFLLDILDVLNESEHSGEALVLRRSADRLDRETTLFYQSPLRAVAGGTRVRDDVAVTLQVTWEGTPYTHESAFCAPFSLKGEVEQFLNHVENLLQTRHPDLRLTPTLPLSQVLAPRAALRTLGDTLVTDTATAPYGEALRTLALSQVDIPEALRRREQAVDPRAASRRRFP